MAKRGSVEWLASISKPKGEGLCSAGHDVTFPGARNKYGQCKICRNVYQAAYKRANPKKFSPYNVDYHRRKKYGVTPVEYARMMVEQNGLCAICKEQDSRGRALDVDHNHETGVVRGLLCNTCNMTLGKVKDNTELLKSMIAYLEDKN